MVAYERYNLPIMLKIMAIVALFLLVSPMDTNAETSKRNKTPKGGGQSSVVAPVVTESTDGPKLQPVPLGHVDADVRVVSTPTKDRYDKAAVWINVALAGVGFATCCVIFWQSWQTRIAAQATLVQAEISRKAFISQYRPRIAVRNAKGLQYNFALGDPWIWQVRLQMVNTGGSPARITEGSYIQIVSAVERDMGKVTMKTGDQCPIGSATLAAGESTFVDECLSTGAVFDITWANLNEGIPIRPFRYISLTGVIYYFDDLEIPRSTSIHRTLDFKTGNFIPNKESEEEYND